MKLKILVAALFILGWRPALYAADSETPEIIPNCDIPTGDFASTNAKDPEGCWHACKGIPKCQAFTFISGWNKCLLKTSTKTRTGVRFYSGKYSRDAKIETEEGFDIDYPGHDIHPTLKTSDNEGCLAECMKNTKCVAYGFLAGYDQCWLKSKADRKQTKVFSCGIVRR
ncbi:MAG: PAN domain-containing protein [Oligoflexales bacterium]